MNVVLTIVLIVFLIVVFLIGILIAEAMQSKSKSYKDKCNSENMLNNQEKYLSYRNTMDTLDAIIENYIAEDRLFNPYGEGKDSYVSEKDTANIIKEVTTNILDELSPDVYAALSVFIKPEKINDVINRRVTIGVVSNVAEINKQNSDAAAAATRKNKNMEKIIWCF